METLCNTQEEKDQLLRQQASTEIDPKTDIKPYRAKILNYNSDDEVFNKKYEKRKA
jgi:hypothetical protein